MTNEAGIKNTDMQFQTNPDNNICRDVNGEDEIYVNTEFIDSDKRVA